MRQKPGDGFNEALVMNGHDMYLMTSLNKAPKELCRIKKAVKDLIKQNPDGMTHSEICTRLQQQSLFLGTYRNLFSQASSALRLLTEEGVVISKGTGSLKMFIYSH
jgi:hypothetical protein